MSSASPIDRTAVLTALRAHVVAELEALTTTQKETQAGATHEEARPEHDKDTRAIESSYLARGLAKRVTELHESASQLATLALQRFTDDTPIALTALVTVEDDEGAIAHYFVAPTGGGIKLIVDDAQVGVVTPQSPLGRALVGKRCDDELEVRTASGARGLTVVQVS